VDDDIDTKAREIMQTLYNMSKFLEGEEFAQKLHDNYGSYVVLDGPKDRGILYAFPPFSYSPFLLYLSFLNLL
jgi:hypothetical protein